MTELKDFTSAITESLKAQGIKTYKQLQNATFEPYADYREVKFVEMADARLILLEDPYCLHRPFGIYADSGEFTVFMAEEGELFFSRIDVYDVDMVKAKEIMEFHGVDMSKTYYPRDLTVDMLMTLVESYENGEFTEVTRKAVVLK